ncbi:F0F1 ATP synthase subunit gamma [Blochmannia endosymbiont of Camponotus (Colobopsis) obliquus]|uniref:F0F1 ATP synthase subunit gamma n=1 Tax=Blochmannia endosymbiont of Camponotus (Colobopsis) obliquus TaxID=1505597 RepID=UPI00061A56E7|nr:F0F1 ATP synthase subunit gamma [Blochmannia endosymbiont of Camponotus (Colobopsis) obliquus]AKC60192.1 ATP synthase gamma chain [Blochmannia endosymbiont of Camponotus (Colobopsis) obliquus]
MLGTKEIRNKIDSIQKIQKIAKAMEMVSASKMRKVHQIMSDSNPYVNIMQKVIGHILSGNLEYKHPFAISRDIKRVGYLVISTDRGLVGSLNANLFKILLADIKKRHVKKIDINCVLIGKQAVSFLRFLNDKIVAKVIGIGDRPTLSVLIGAIKIILQLYEECYLDRLFVVYNKFINILFQQPKILQLLPICSLNNVVCKSKKWDYIYEPDAKNLLDILLQRYIESQVYQKVVENLVSEQAARMMAMKGASDNGNALIKDLKLIYNKARQSNITQELAEIISSRIIF